MNKLRFVIFLISIVFAALIFTVNGSADPIPGPFTLYLPAVEREEPAALNAEVVVNHLTTDIQAIPGEWTTAARASVIHFAHTSHGSQILTGLGWLENYDSKYAIDVTFSKSAPPNPAYWLGFYDGNSYATNYITPDMYWESSDGIAKTYETLETGYFDYTLWTWCGQMSSYSNPQVNTYLRI